jgi:hypothetical protein
MKRGSGKVRQRDIRYVQFNITLNYTLVAAHDLIQIITMLLGARVAQLV